MVIFKPSQYTASASLLILVQAILRKNWNFSLEKTGKKIQKKKKKRKKPTPFLDFVAHVTRRYKVNSGAYRLSPGAYRASPGPNGSVRGLLGQSTAYRVSPGICYMKEVG